MMMLKDWGVVMLTARRFAGSATLLLLATSHLAAQDSSRGERLARAIERESHEERRAARTRTVTKLDSREQAAFVAWVRRRRVEERLWSERHFPALALIGTGSAATELGLAARAGSGDQSQARLAQAALAALLRCPPSEALRELLQGVLSPDKDVSALHQNRCVDYLGSGDRQELLTKLVNFSQESRLALARQAEDADGAPAAAEGETALSSLVARAFVRSEHPAEFVEGMLLGGPPSVAAGVARGVRDRLAKRGSRLRKALRRYEKQQEHVTSSGRFETPLEAVLRLDPSLEPVSEMLAEERARFEPLLLTLAQERGEEPIVLIEVFETLLELIPLSEERDWVELLIDALGHPSRKVRDTAYRTIQLVTDVTWIQQSERAWRLWWQGTKEDTQ